MILQLLHSQVAKQLVMYNDEVRSLLKGIMKDGK